MFDFEFELSKLPDLPGIYLMRDENDKIIYVGKAKNLRKRVSQYFIKSKNMLPRTKLMVSTIERFETIVANSELEALILERNLIKKHRPQFNIMLKDDKNYPLIKVTINEEYPKVIMTRKKLDDGAKYFGPYTSAYAVKENIDILNSIYPLKKCNKVFPRDIGKERPCINYQIGKCLAPCQGGVNKEKYRKMIDDVCDFLSGNINEMIEQYKKQMEVYSNDLNFEKAIRLRDRIEAIQSIKKKQNVSMTKLENGDFIAIHGNDVIVSIQLFFLRGNNIVGRHTHFIEKPIEKEYNELLEEFIMQYYDKEKIIPSKIYTQYEIENKEEVEEYLSKIIDKKVIVINPKRGEKRRIISMAANNARVEFRKRMQKMIEKDEFYKKSLKELSDYLGIDTIERIEAFDVSNTTKNDTVAGMIVFDKDSFDRRSYRKFTIRGDYGINDYMAMREVVHRRYRYLSDREKDSKDRIKVSNSFLIEPDLVLIDGGLGHVSSVKEAIGEYGLDFNIVGMSKDKKHKTKALVFEGEVFDIRKNPRILQLVNMIQDEVHRFSIEFNRNRRKKRVIYSKLDDIEGIGPKRKKMLLKKFGSVKSIKNASIEEISSVKNISKKTAQRIKNNLV